GHHGSPLVTMSTAAARSTVIRSVTAFGLIPLACVPQSADFQVREATIADIHAALVARRLTCAQLVQKYLDRIDALDKKGPAINAVIVVNAGALDDARAIDAEIARNGISKPLQCIPMIIKDN